MIPVTENHVHLSMDIQAIAFTEPPPFSGDCCGKYTIVRMD